MPSEIWSTLAFIAGPPLRWCTRWCSGRGRAGLVVAGEHGDEVAKCAGEPALVELLVWCVGDLPSDDTGEDDDPVALDVVDRGVGADEAASLQLGDPVPAGLDHRHGRRKGLRRRF